MALQTLRYQVPGLNADPTAPILGFGDLLTHGSLAYVEPSRDGLTAAPAVGDSLVNYARGSLSRMTGAAMADLDAVLTDNSLTPGVGRMELTAKGALHGYVNTAAASALFARISVIPAAAQEWILANPTHEYLFCAGVRRTGAAVLVAAPAAPAARPIVAVRAPGSVTAAGQLFYIQYKPDSGAAGDGARTIIYPASGYTGVTLFAKEDLVIDTPTRITAARGTNFPADITDEIVGEVRWDPPANSGGIVQGGNSFIFDFFFAEDLTESGRAAAAVNTLLANKKSADFASGGRYYGDTWTDPATVVWS